MSSLNLKLHSYHSASIKDLSHDLDISDHKWSAIFKFLTEDSQAIYFYGTRLWVKGEALAEQVFQLYEELLYVAGDPPIDLLFRLKPSVMLFNRSLLSQLWECYEYPSLIFLQNQTDEDSLLTLLEKNTNHNSVLDLIDGVKYAYKNFEPNVLWLNCSIDTPSLERLEEIINAV